MYLDGPKSPADFWSNEDFWPREDKRFWFIARAFNMIGRALFPDNWTGAEGHTQVIRPLPAMQHLANDWERSVASRIIKDRYPDVEQPSEDGRSALTLLGTGLRSASMWFDDSHWLYAREVWTEHLVKRQDIINRRRAVAEWIVDKAHDEKTLRMVVVDKRNSNPFLDAPEHWNLKWDKLDYRWEWCAYNWGEPNNPRAPLTHDIFVFREDLDRLLSGLTSASQGMLEFSASAPAEENLPQLEKAADSDQTWRVHTKDDLAALIENGQPVLDRKGARMSVARANLALALVTMFDDESGGRRFMPGKRYSRAHEWKTRPENKVCEFPATKAAIKSQIRELDKHYFPEI